MNLENLLNDLLKRGKIKKQQTDISYLNALLGAAFKNFQAAKYNLAGGYLDASFKSAYDGLLQISRAILLLNGFRPDDGEQHKTTFAVAGVFLGQEFNELIGIIDRYRIKRNNIVYEPLVLISKTEAENILKSSEEYWLKVKKYLKSQGGQLELFDF
jgi:uncharacterized protein (UPF0332 family)